MVVLGFVVLALVGCAIVWGGSGWLDTASERLAVYYELPPVVRGAVIAAVGSSFPELSTTVISTLVHGSFELGVAAIVGSAIFNILVIPAVSCLFGGGPLSASREVVYKEALFYMLAVAALMLAFTFAVVYLPDPSGRLVGTMSRWIAAGPVALYLLYLFTQFQDAQEYHAEPPEEPVQAWREWGRLVASLALILVGVELLVKAALGLGQALGTSEFLWGVTVVAAGTSLPDAFVSARAAKAGDGETSLANVLGSNTFDLLIALPVGILIAGSATISLGTATPMMAALTFATLILFVMLRTDMSLSRAEAVGLLALYAAFVVWMVLETVGVTSLMR